MLVDIIDAKGQNLAVCPGQRAAEAFKLPNMGLQPFETCRSPSVSPVLRGKRAVPGVFGRPRHRSVPLWVQNKCSCFVLICICPWVKPDLLFWARMPPARNSHCLCSPSSDTNAPERRSFPWRQTGLAISRICAAVFTAQLKTQFFQIYRN